jgi:hypothetical protein
VAYDWAADLDRCPVCISVHLVRRLGEVECRDCGAVGQPVPSSADSGPDAAAAAAAELADEVERALSRVLGPGRGRPPYAMS